MKWVLCVFILSKRKSFGIFRSKKKRRKFRKIIPYNFRYIKLREMLFAGRGWNICVDISIYLLPTDFGEKKEKLENKSTVVEMTSFVSCPGGLLTRNCSMRKEHLSLPSKWLLYITVYVLVVPSFTCTTFVERVKMQYQFQVIKC